MMNEAIFENIQRVREKIENSAKRAGRDASDITLIGVSKTVDIERIKCAVDCGVTSLGENRVQELLEKYDAINDAEWHLIGHLQTNKVKYIVDKVKLIHSVDSIKLMDEIELRAKGLGVSVDFLLQVNLSGEETKFGMEKSEVQRLADYAESLKNARLCGLMTVPPPVLNPNDNKRYFNELFELAESIKASGCDNINMNILSMGMSGDYEAAIECGATMVRVGSAIFGHRNYKGGTQI